MTRWLPCSLTQKKGRFPSLKQISNQAQSLIHRHSWMYTHILLCLLRLHLLESNACHRLLFWNNIQNHEILFNYKKNDIHPVWFIWNLPFRNETFIKKSLSKRLEIPIIFIFLKCGIEDKYCRLNYKHLELLLLQPKEDWMFHKSQRPIK